MDLVSLVLVLVVVGVCLYLVENFIPLSPPVKTVIRVVVVIVLCLFLLRAFGVNTTLPIRNNGGP